MEPVLKRIDLVRLLAKNQKTVIPNLEVYV